MTRPLFVMPLLEARAPVGDGEYILRHALSIVLMSHAVVGPEFLLYLVQSMTERIKRDGIDLATTTWQVVDQAARL